MQKLLVEINFMRQQVLQKFWPLASLVLVLFILTSFLISKDYFNGFLYLFYLIGICIAMPLCLKNEKVLLAANILCGVGMLTLISFIFTGGPTGSGFWWLIVYVIGAFLVTTKRWAIFWLSFYLLVSFSIVILSHHGFVKIEYSTFELLYMLFIYVITFGFVYFFNEVREYYLELSIKRTEELSQLNKELLSANKELESFAYVASHDLQEPLQPKPLIFCFCCTNSTL